VSVPECNKGTIFVAGNSSCFWNNPHSDRAPYDNMHDDQIVW
jgi:hypothetical protein